MKTIGPGARLLALWTALLAVEALAACGDGGVPALTVGAVYPLAGPQAEPARQELAGLEAALRLAGRPVRLRVRSVGTPDQARAAVDHLVDQDHVPVVLGAYDSGLADAAASRAEQRHVVYWETGVTADQVTLHRAYAFRAVAAGSGLGRTVAQFTSDVLVPRAGQGRPPPRAVIVGVDDAYGRSVADGAQGVMGAGHGPVLVDRVSYDAADFDPGAIAHRIDLDRADYLWDVSYLEDGLAIWRSIVQQGVHLRAFVAATPAFSRDLFGQRLGAQAVGVYAADEPDDQVGGAALSPAARELLARARAAYAAQGLGPAMSPAAVAGFVSGWALFHDVLPRVRGAVTPGAVRGAAGQVDEPPGTSIDGGGLRFGGPDPYDQGQNVRTATTIAQWQAVNVLKTVYPPPFGEAPVLFPGS